MVYWHRLLHGIHTELICMYVFECVSRCDKPMRLKVGKSTSNTWLETNENLEFKNIISKSNKGTLRRPSWLFVFLRLLLWLQRCLKGKYSNMVVRLLKPGSTYCNRTVATRNSRPTYNVRIRILNSSKCMTISVSQYLLHW